MVVMIDHGLAVMSFSERNDVPNISVLYGIVAISFHECERIVEPTFIIARGRRRFVMHYETQSLGMGIIVKRRNVEIGIRGDEVEYIFFLAAAPVFPTFVPSFHQDAVKPVLRGEVDIASDVFVVGPVPAVRFGRRIIRNAEFNCRIVPSIGPGALAGYHLPPNAQILDGMNPGDIFQCTGLVEIQYQAGSKRLAGIVGHLYGPPRRLAGCLHASLPSFSVGAEPAAEGKLPGVCFKMHCRIVFQGCFVNVDV